MKETQEAFAARRSADWDRLGALVTGGLVFGVGWGLAGYCPGPALANLAHGGEAIAFVVAMLAGSQLARLLQAR